MASVASPTPQSQSSRRRGTVNSNSKETTTEDQALNMIAREAEARLAAKRAARAEARSIRMKEIERKQKEAEDDAANSEDSESLDETVYVKRSNMRMSSPTIPSFEYPDSPPSNAMQLTNDAHVIQLKEHIRDGDVKYKKAMVSAAQLDNEKQALQYQVEILKDIIEELQQKIENTDDELVHKCREYNKLSREHNNTSAELKKCILLLEDRERILDENGINLDGTVKEGYGLQASSAQCSLCSASLNEDSESAEDHRERGSLLAEIASLKGEVEELRKTSNSEQARRELDAIKTERVELEQSFADVSNEAAVIREDALHAGLYVNNNEKNDEFEMIDDGSQQGGIRHFEDQSFEKSTSSITSSMMTDMTDHRTTSMESSIPYVIDVDSIPSKPVQKDDYDIVHVGDTTATTIRSPNIHVDSYTSVEYRPPLSLASEPSSNINVNKYLFDDHDDTLNDDSEHYSTFCVDRYFATEMNNVERYFTPESSNCDTVDNVGSGVSSDNTKALDGINPDDNNDLQTSVDTITNVQLDYDTIDPEDVLTNPEVHVFSEENRDSPYEDVQVESFVTSRPSDGMVIIEEKLGSDKFDETSVESSDIRLLKNNEVSVSPTPDVTLLDDMSVMQINADADFIKMSPSEDALVMQTHADTEFIVPSEQLVNFEEPSDGEPDNVLDPSSSPSVSVSLESSPDGSLSQATAIHLSPATSQFTVPVDIGHDENVTEVEGDANISKPEDAISIPESNTSMESANDTSMNTAFCIGEEVTLTRVESITESDKIALRQNVEDLYNQIAGEASIPLATISDTDMLECESSVKTGLTKVEGDQTGWSVQVESFPETQTPEIQVLDTDPQSASEPHPEPKERKKKKKKKKSERMESEASPSNHTEFTHDTVMPSDPLLLGFADGETKKTETENKPLRPKSDIPKQFLDASADLIDNSYSDTSDMEDGEIGEDEDGVKKKSSKRSKKEGCKSQ